MEISSFSNYYPACTDADKEFINKLLDPAAESTKKRKPFAEDKRFLRTLTIYSHE